MVVRNLYLQSVDESCCDSVTPCLFQQDMISEFFIARAPGYDFFISPTVMLAPKGIWIGLQIAVHQTMR